MKRNKVLFVTLLSLSVLFGFRGEAADTLGSVGTPGNAFALYKSGSYAYVADDFAGLTVVDVSNSQNPTIVGSVDTSGYTHGVFVSGNYAYLADTSGGFLVVDVANPDNPQIVGSPHLMSDSVEDVFISGAYAYLAIKSMGLQILDITDPSQPIKRGRAYSTDETDTRGVCVVGSYAYIADGAWGFRIADVTNPGKPRIVGSVDTPGTALNVSVLGSYAYVADGEGGLQVIDITAAAHPAIVATVAPKGYSRGLYISYPYVYLADDHDGGLRAINVANPLTPVEKAQILTPGYVFDVQVSGNNAYVADYVNLRIIDIGSLMNRIVSSVDTPGNALDVDISSPYAFVADDGSGLQVVQVGNPLSPSLYGSVTTPGNARGVSVSASYAYLADGPAGLQVINIDNPQYPALVGSLQTDGFSEGLFVSEPYLYLADGDSGLQVIDVFFPESPSLVSSLPVPGYAMGVALAGGYAFLAAGSAGLHIIDVTQPTAPVIVNSVSSSYAQSVFVRGSCAYVADGTDGLLMVDISDPLNAGVTGWVETDGASNGVYRSGLFAYVADGSNGLQVITVSDPVFPDLVNTVDTPGSAKKVAVYGNYAYVADEISGLQIIDKSMFSCGDPTPTVPGSISYPASDSDGNFVISWSAASGAANYIVQRATNSSFTGAVTAYRGPGNSFSFNETGLPTNTYYYRVQAKNDCGNSGWRPGSGIAVTSFPAPPQTLTYPSTNCSTGFTVTWSASSGATAYSLQMATNASFADAATVYTGSLTSFNQPSLTPGTYYYRVKASNAAGASAWKNGGPLQVITTLPAPATLSYPETTCAGNFTVTWASVGGAMGYTVERATNFSFTGAVTAYSGPLSSFNEQNLAAGTYYYRVRANNVCGGGTWKTGGAVVISPSPPAPASISYPSSSCEGNFTVTWQAVAGATYYTLQRDLSAAFTNPTENTTSSTSFNQGSLASGTYFFRVRANTVCGSGAWQTGLAVTVIAPPPAPVSIAYPDTNCDGNFTVTWQPVTEATSYVLQRATNSSFTDATQVYAGTATSYYQPSLAPSVYYYRIRGSNTCGTGNWKAGAAVTVTTRPPTPGSPSYPSENCGGTYTVSWSSVSSATGYTLQRATNDSFTNATTIYSGFGTFYSETNVVTGTYYYRLQASNQCGSSDWKSGAAITVVGTPPQPTNINYPASNCGGTFTVSWSAVSGATTYTLQRAPNSSFSSAETVYTGATNSFNQTNLGSGVYYYRVQAANGCGPSVWQSGLAISVSGAPSAPGYLSYPASVCGNSLSVSWPAVQGATSYTLQRDTTTLFTNPSQIYEGPLTSYSDTPPAAGTFYYRVRANGGCGASDWVIGIGATVTPLPGTPETINYPSSSCTGNFTVSWSPVNGTTYYALERSTDASFTNSLQLMTSPATSYDQTGLPPGDYFYRVRANSCGAGKWKAGGAVTVGTSLPASSPTTITYPSTSSTGSFTVSWSAVNEAASYTLERATSDSFANPVQIYTGTATSYSQTKLAAGKYYFRVRANSDCGNSEWRSGGALVVSNNQPPDISVPPIIGPTTGKTGIGYKFTGQATDPDGNTLKYRFDWGDGAVSSWSTSASVWHKWLAPGEYCVKVQAKDSAGALSEWSACTTIKVTSRPPVLAGPPTGPTTGVKNTAYTYTGQATDPDGDPVQYRFSWGDGSKSSWSPPPSRTHKWATPGNYCVKVQARDDKGVVCKWSACLNIDIGN